MDRPDRHSGSLPRLARLFAWLGAAVLVAIMLLTFADVVGRTFFSRALVGTVETITLLMGVLVFFGLGWTEVANRHIRVDTFVDLAPSAIKRVITVITSLLSLFVATALMWRLLVQTLDQILAGETTQIWSIPFWPTAVAMSVGMTLFVAALAWRSRQALTTLFGRPQ